MKIAILTQPLHTNYGGILQAYAVQKILRDRGHDVVTLDIPLKEERTNDSFYMQMRLFVVTLASFLLCRIKINNIEWPYNTKKRNKKLIRHSMRSFISRIIRLSPTIETKETLDEYIREQHFDAYIVGSDQVWRPLYSPHIGWFFLDFLPDRFRGKRIALSASFGTSEWEFSNEQTEYLKSFAQKFAAVSVREKSGVDLCKKYFDVFAKQVLDPTMMLTIGDYKKLVKLDKHHTYSMRGSIFSYVLDTSNEARIVTDRISTILGLSVQYLNARSDVYGPYTNKKRIVKYFPMPVSQWLRGFQETDFVVTDSFHGTVFSILHHKPFVVIANETRGLARIETLLKTFNLEGRLICSDANYNREWLLNGIHWDKVDLSLKVRREEFMDFIKTVLDR